VFGNPKKKFLKFLTRCEFIVLRQLSDKFRYQPAPRGLASFSRNIDFARQCEDRLAIIRTHLPANSRNMIDLGSNSGFYLFRLAELGLICHGLERDAELVYFTNLGNYLLNGKGISCECGKLDLAYIQGMPDYDVILCLSLMHHIILEDGMETAEEILRGLARKTRHVLFFEMGQSNEIAADWSADLPAMEPNPEVWIWEWLKRCGFQEVIRIGSSRTTVARYLFCAYPSSAARDAER
jgi:hypothetical protein